MKDRFTNLYIDIAYRVSKLSRAERLKVGAVIVTPNDTVTYGWNGTPAGWDNNCEDKEYINADAGSWLSSEEIIEKWPYEDQKGRYRLITKPEVLHAERNAIDKLAKNTISGEGSSLFCTHAPCLECAKSIYGAGIKQVFYSQDYRSTNGIEFLKKCGVTVTQIKKGQ